MSTEYKALGQEIIDNGFWINNERTGKRCRTIPYYDFKYDVSEGIIPALTTKKVNFKMAIMEMLGYLRGYTSAAQFRAIGCKTWDQNANETKAWLSNPNRKGTDDIGRSYGPQIRNWQKPGGGTVDQLRKVYDDLKAGYDDRSEILSFLNPGEKDLCVLNACMHSHTFTLIDGVLFLKSDQRSCDVPLGLGFNQIQVAWLLMIMAQITGNKASIARHCIVNCHVYEDQYDKFVNVQMPREAIPCQPKLIINPDIKTLEDLETWVTVDDFEIEGYEHHGHISFPMSA